MSEPKSRRIPKPIWFGVAAVVMVVCGCSESPLSDIATSKPDSDIVGTWHSTNVDVEGKLQDVYWHIGNAGDVAPSHGDFNFANKESKKILHRNLMRAIMVETPRKRIKSNQFIFFTTKIGKMRFANVPIFSKSNDIAYYSLFKYEVSNNQLIVQSIEFTKAVTTGKLKGKKGYWLTDSTENIVRYLEHGGDKTLFPDSKKLVYQRVKPADRRD